MVSRVFTFIALAGAPALLLSACGKKDDSQLAALDAQLTSNTADPALQGALQDQIMVDPNLVGKSNANSVRPADRPLDGAVPVLGQVAAAQTARAATSGMMHAPAPTEASTDCGSCTAARPVTLGGLARSQGQGKCASRLKYGPEWADRLPAEFRLYPGANLSEAAGTEGGACNLRVASFSAAVPMNDVIDYYYTQAVRGGYDAEHQLRNGEHVLGGTRNKDDGAYYITFNPRAGGGTDVDIIANNGR